MKTTTTKLPKKLVRDVHLHTATLLRNTILDLVVATKEYEENPIGTENISDETIARIFSKLIPVCEDVDRFATFIIGHLVRFGGEFENLRDLHNAPRIIEYVEEAFETMYSCEECGGPFLQRCIAEALESDRLDK